MSTPAPDLPPVTTERRTRPWIAIAVIAAVFFYFLIFAEFSFLESAQAIVGTARLRLVMGVMGLSGIVGSFAVGWRYHADQGRNWLGGGLAACALASALVAFATMPWEIFAAAALIGLGLAASTVALALCLRPSLHSSRLGLWCGWGTGLAYWGSNQLLVFEPSAKTEAVVATLVAMVGIAFSRWLRSTPVRQSSSPDFNRAGVALWVALLLSLVWFDSGAFYIIQHNPTLKQFTWEGTLALQGNAFIHLCTAILAGLALDRHRAGFSAVFAISLLAGACLLLNSSPVYFPSARVLYTAGVSIYSTLLVYYPARSGRPWIAAAVYAVAGWLGSALGIGMAQDLHRIPTWFVGVASALAIASLCWRRYRLNRMLPAATASVLLLFLSNHLRAEDPLVLGRKVYLEEGCMHCHSQYVRPRTEDVTLWGPAAPLETRLQESPPLFGNRRQGPDLTNVGNRRSPEWNRLHLQNPRQFAAGSRMPSYRHLFAAGNPRGEALVAYLASLGEDTLSTRLALARVWAPTSAHPLSLRDQQQLFARACAGCHGPSGDGAGPLTAQLSVHPPNFQREAWRYADRTALPLSLARIIKFGLPRTPMAGHEYLSDDEIVSLAAFVEGLHGKSTLP